MIDFNKLIERYLARVQRPKEIGRYYPSEVGSCIRKVWYSYKYPQELKPELLKVFELGNIMHDFVVEVLKSEKTKEVKLLKSEIPFSIERKDFLISGRVDDLILVRKNNKKVLVEVKSSKDVSKIRRAQSNHSIQLLFYMFVLRVFEGIILYIDKNNLQSKVFEVKYDERKAKEISKRFEILHKSLKENFLPIDEAKRIKDMNWMCRFCEYKVKCDENER